MKRLTNWGLHLFLIFSSVVGISYAADDSFASQFLGSPLLVLVVILIADAVALIYHRARK
jgi:hypothetical protein